MNRPLNGTVLSDRYELSELLGSGGMAEVWLGRDRVLGRTVAVKTLHTQYAGDPHFIERFRREAQSAAALNHPNIVSVYDTGSDDGTYYIVMEYVEGKTLRDVVREEGPLLPERAAEIAADTCAGLAFAHSRGIVHRDVKPANIMLTPAGTVKVADFGIARAVSGDTVTQTAMVLGTAQYFSPEQAQSAPVDGRSDIYSLGVVLYEMLTRQVPFTGSSPVAIAYKHVKEDPMLPSRLNPDVPQALESIVMKALAKNPDNRYQSANDMREDLMRALHGRPVEATPVLADATGVISPLADDTIVIERRPGMGTTTTTVRRPRTEEEKRRRTGMLLLALIGVAILGVAAWALMGLLGEKNQVTIPDLVCDSVAEAQNKLEQRNLEVVFAPEVFSECDSGTIATQDPEAGQTIEEGGTVTLAISKGPELVKVPDVKGKSESRATELIKEAGLKVGDINRRPDSQVPRGIVISQDPSDDTQVRKGREVNLVVSEGRPTTKVPDVIGFSQDDAKVRLENAGLRVQVVREEQSADCDQPVGDVCRQTPEGGAVVSEGSSVTIYVSKEPEQAPAACNDGEDNDGDGLIDVTDPGCANASDDDETNEGATDGGATDGGATDGGDTGGGTNGGGTDGGDTGGGSGGTPGSASENAGP